MAGECMILKDKVIVISGGTKGVGKGVAIEAAKQGAKIVIAGRDERAAKTILDEIHKLNGEAVFAYADLKNIDSCDKMFQTALDNFGKVDGFVNYAGVTHAATLLECSEEVFDDIFDINIKAAFFCVQSAVKYMKENGGSIILFGSPHDDKGEVDRAAYACSKGALSVLTTHVAKYYAEYGIRANYLTMGWTPTEGELALRREQGMSEEQLRELAAKMVPAGRIQEVEDYVPAVLFLLSDYSKMVMGANLRITGGLYF